MAMGFVWGCLSGSQSRATFGDLSFSEAISTTTLLIASVGWFLCLVFAALYNRLDHEFNVILCTKTSTSYRPGVSTKQKMRQLLQF
jgi:hypothetical protein